MNPGDLLAILSEHMDSSLEAMLRGIRRVREREQLDLRIQVVPPSKPRQWPEQAYWISRKAALSKKLSSCSPKGAVVCPFGRESPHRHICCETDNALLGSMAAEHFQEQGFNSILLLKKQRHRHHTSRLQAFARASRRLGLRVEEIPYQTDPIPGILELLQKHPRRAFGIYCPSDAEAHWLRSVLHQHQLPFPQQLGLLGTGGHSSLCFLDEPHLSSLEYPWEEIGEIATEHIASMIRGESLPAPHTLRNIQIRLGDSTQRRSLDDPLMQQARAWMRSHLEDPKPLEGLCGELKRSPATVCRLFKQNMGISPKRYQQQIRINAAKELLRDPRLQLSEIAFACGFNSRASFTHAFKQDCAMSPSAWRLQENEA